MPSPLRRTRMKALSLARRAVLDCVTKTPFSTCPPSLVRHACREYAAYKDSAKVTLLCVMLVQ